MFPGKCTSRRICQCLHPDVFSFCFFHFFPIPADRFLNVPVILPDGILPGSLVFNKGFLLCKILFLFQQCSFIREFPSDAALKCRDCRIKHQNLIFQLLPCFCCLFYGCFQRILFLCKQMFFALYVLLCYSAQFFLKLLFLFFQSTTLYPYPFRAKFFFMHFSFCLFQKLFKLKNFLSASVPFFKLTGRFHLQIAKFVHQIIQFLKYSFIFFRQ